MIISVELEYPIGTEFWFFRNNKIELGLISEISISITTYTDENKGWWDQLFDRYSTRTQKDVYKQSFSYKCKLEGEIWNSSLYKRNSRWYVLDYPVYFSKEDLIKSLSK